MIILDTNVISELMTGRTGIDPWLARVRPADLYTTVMTRAEIRYGLALLPDGRRDALLARAAALFAEVADRTLPFDRRAADRYGDITATRRRNGRPISVPDAIIASISWANQAPLATRNVSDFAGCDIEVVSPFDS